MNSLSPWKPTVAEVDCSQTPIRKTIEKDLATAPLYNTGGQLNKKQQTQLTCQILSG